MKTSFYEGEPWKSELEAIAMPMLQDYSIALTVTTPGFTGELVARSSPAVV